MAYEHILVEREGPITIVTLNRPQVFNAFTSLRISRWTTRSTNSSADPDQWVAIVTGAGDKAFSAGNDLKFQAAGGERGWGKSGFGGASRASIATSRSSRPSTAFAMGGGSRSLACDLIVAAENAIFALPEPSVGLAALAGGLVAPAAHHRHEARHGHDPHRRRVSAGRGRALGFVHEVAPVGGSLDAAKAIARKICELSPMSIRASKQIAIRGANQSLAQALVDQGRGRPSRRCAIPADFIEGPKAFAEKRKPKWTGR